MRAHQMPGQSNSNCRIADCGTDQPDDDDGLKFLELFKFRDVVNRDGGADPADCD